MKDHSKLHLKSSISRQLLGILFILFALSATSIILSITDKSEEKQSVIDLAGRNRMLSQRIVMLADRWQAGNEIVKEDLVTSIDLLGQSLTSLEQGGGYPGGDPNVTIAPVPEVVRPSLRLVLDEWEKYDAAALKVFHDRGSPEAEEALDYLHANANGFLQLNNNVVTEYKNHYTAKNELRANMLLLLSFLALLPLIFGVLLVWNRVHKPLRNLIAKAHLIAQGKLVTIRQRSTQDEVWMLAGQLNEQNKTLREIAAFAEAIGKKDFEHTLSPRSEEDELSHAILRMKDQLQELNKEEQLQQRVADGVAYFSDLGQKEYESIEDFCRFIIKELVNWLDANQGAMFILKEDEKEDTEMMVPCGVYAWERYKQNGNGVAWGEGLVGRAWQEKDTLFFTEVPNRYINITSGLGKANPDCILIVPVMHNQEVVGVIELASFHVFQKHEIEFVKKVSESFAVAISTRQINDRTRKLLEESQDNASQLRMQEEEMRQNMEELEATQEDMRRRGEMMQKQLQSIYDIGLAHVEFDMKGHVLFANEAFVKCMGYDTVNEIKGRHHRIFMSPEAAASPEYAAFWANLRNGEHIRGEFWRKSRTGEDVLIKGAYNVSLDQRGNPEKVVKFALDITPENHKDREQEVPA